MKLGFEISQPGIVIRLEHGIVSIDVGDVQFEFAYETMMATSKHVTAFFNILF